MKGRLFLLIAFSFIIIQAFLKDQELKGQDFDDILNTELYVYQDSQILYNGRIWNRTYSNIIGNEFLFSAVWFRGDVITGNETFHDRMLRYDIVIDELLIRRPDGVIIALNRETTSGFTLKNDNTEYRFINLGLGEERNITGYACVLYEGKCNLLLKSVKEITPLGYRRVFDIFTQTDQLFVMKEGTVFRLKGRKGLLDFLDDKRDELRKYMRNNNLIIMPRQPESVIPVLVYYDSLVD
ncbi:MAG: hypothetical protein K0B05_02830 [Bacteroidales bacterium]|nr:hypothetical protein [Bacteroidales bacterium]